MTHSGHNTRTQMRRATGPGLYTQRRQSREATVGVAPLSPHWTHARTAPGGPPGVLTLAGGRDHTMVLSRLPELLRAGPGGGAWARSPPFPAAVLAVCWPMRAPVVF